MDFNGISFEDRHLFDGFEYLCSDYIFSYIYMYSDLYKLKLYHDDRTVIISQSVNSPVFYVPLGDTEYGVKLVVDYCKALGLAPIFVKVTEKYFELFDEFKFKLKEDRNSFDYVFKNSDLASYKGKKYRKQRNNLSNYLRTVRATYTDDIYNHIDECKAFTYKFYNNRKEIYNPTIKILGRAVDLGCRGGIVWDGPSIQGYCIYESISKDTALSHVELTDNTERGVHSFMIKNVSSDIDEDYINKEDDMGLPGLRRFKESYSPCFMIKKYIASK
ncbi:MAG: phosphatidylglycerol lysyltransferase domain-containing protein [Clostridiales bacterium]|nr:phosphatidylglycerol lysyltransferase domain-containing protein [Clostridiales bacterium]